MSIGNSSEQQLAVLDYLVLEGGGDLQERPSGWRILRGNRSWHERCCARAALECAAIARKNAELCGARRCVTDAVALALLRRAEGVA